MSAPNTNAMADVLRSPPPPCALVVGLDPEETRLTSNAVSRALGIRVVSLLHDDGRCSVRDGTSTSFSRDGLCRDGTRLALDPGPFPGCWQLQGATSEDACVCGSDPTNGLVTSLGFTCVLCVVGIHREPCLGEDGAGASSMRAGRRTSIMSGTPTIVTCVPTTTKNARVDGARTALETMLTYIKNSNVVSLTKPHNSPRAHFPFPTKNRWDLGSSAMPLPDHDLARSLFGTETSSLDFATKDCWSLGGFGAVTPVVVGDDADTEREQKNQTHNASSLRSSLRDAFRDGDVFLSLNVPPKWNLTTRFSTCRPGVLWRQERVVAVFENGEGGENMNGESYEKVNNSNDSNDSWGRTLPSRAVGSDRDADENDTRFVRQLATEGLVSERGYNTIGTDDTNQASQPPTGKAPASFIIGGGTVVADECVGGDVDAVFRAGGGAAAVTMHASWPISHPLALRDEAVVESLRACRETGLPLWLVEQT